MKKRVLFLCVHNSARSQMAEAFLNKDCGTHFEAESAGLEPGRLNPLVVEVLKEKDIDISGKETRAAADLIRSGQRFDYVITVCSESEAAGCPVFPGITQRLHWPFPDPSKLTGDREECLERVRQIRDAIRSKIEAFCQQHCAAGSPS